MTRTLPSLHQSISTTDPEGTLPYCNRRIPRDGIASSSNHDLNYLLQYLMATLISLIFSLEFHSQFFPYRRLLQSV